MPWPKKLRELFEGKVRGAEKRVTQNIRRGCDWSAIEDEVLREDGNGARLSVVMDAIIAAKNWKLLTPIVKKAGDFLDTLDLVYRKGEHGAIPATRAQELEDIYQAFKAAPRYSQKVVDSFMTNVENWACMHDQEACYDWAKSKPEFIPVPAAGLVALTDRPIVGNALAMKILHNADEIARAADAVDWFYHASAGDRDASMDNIRAWQKKLEENSKPKPPRPPQP